MGVVGHILSEGGKLTICVLEEEGSCEVLDFLERQKRSNRAYFNGMIALIQHISGIGLPLHNKRMAEMVGTRPPKEIVEIKKGNLRLFGFIDPRRPGILILAHGWMKSQGNVRRQNDQIAKAEEIFARYKQMPEVPIERGAAS